LFQPPNKQRQFWIFLASDSYHILIIRSITDFNRSGDVRLFITALATGFLRKSVGIPMEPTWPMNYLEVKLFERFAPPGLLPYGFRRAPQPL